jgi:Carboxypeptidase regulatory-like domain
MSTRGRGTVRSVCRIAAVVSALMCAVPAQALQQDDASIVGQVTDDSGGVLPGVTVTATSPSLQVQQLVEVTDARGEYRLSPLRIGIYKVTYTLPGFQSIIREEIRASAGFATRLDVKMGVGALLETITVSGAAPVVDVTSTSTATSFTRETLELTPTSRNGITGLLAQAPGVRGILDVGGNSLNAIPTFVTFGQVAEPWISLEGVSTTALLPSGGNGNYWDYLTVDEARIQTVGATAEGLTRGVQMSAIVKAGGNAFHGGGGFSIAGKSLQSNNIDDDLRALGITSGNSVDKRSDVNAELGGRIIRDKLWFYGSARRREEVAPVLANAQPKPDGSAPNDEQSGYFHTEKLSYQANAANRFTGFYQFYQKDQQSGVTEFVPWEARTNFITDAHTGKIEWQGVFGGKVFSLQYGNWGYSVVYPNNAPGKVRTQDQVTMFVTGPMASAGQRPYNTRHEPKGSFGWYIRDGFAGSHDLRGGFVTMLNAGARPYPQNEDSQPYNYTLIFQDGAAFQLQAYNYPTEPRQETHYFSTYLQDKWTIGRRLAVDGGLRYAHDNGFVPASCRDVAAGPGALAFPAGCADKVQFNVWSSVAPRLHAAIDLTGDGHTVVKGGWARFDHMRQIEPELTLGDSRAAATATYRWRDLNNNRQYDVGEINLDPNLGDYVSQTGVGGVPNPNERQPKSDQFSASFERELRTNLSARVTALYSSNRDNYRQSNILRPYSSYNIPITRPDPGPDGTAGNADDPGTSITYYEYPQAIAGQAFQLVTWETDPNADQTYKSIEIATAKRFSGGLQFSASFTATKKHVPFVNGLTPSDGNSAVRAGELTPNAEIFQDDNTWEQTGKASATYQLPWFGLLTSANFEHRGGAPWARQVRFTGGRTIPQIVLNVEPIGTRRMDDINLLDVRVQKTISLSTARKLVLRLNVFNALNTNAVTGLTMRAGTAFERPTGIIPPRIAELNASFSF